ncbi:MAG: DNA-invertase [Phototrophicales bacterium]|nr:MAG: DNA-invertase [Phototrophicales bacterium]
MKIGYMRVSTEDQRHDLQEDALREAGCDVIYRDKITGRAESREGLDEALSVLSSGDELVVWKLDRLGRKARHLYGLVESLIERGVGFRSLTESFDVSTPMGKAMFQMMGVFAEFERNVNAERVVAGLESARQRGVRLGRPPSLSEGDRAAIIADRRAGMSVRAVAGKYGVSVGTVSRVASGAA